MFLVVFVTVVISIIALFGQVLSVQTARINAAQVGLMQTMMTWHYAAVTIVKTVPIGNMNGLTGCNLTTGACTDGSGNPIAPIAGYVSSTGTAALPSGYNPNFAFNSIAFQYGTPAITYIVTYVPPPSSATGDLFLPDSTGFDTGYKMQDLMRQFAHVTSGGFGGIVAGTITSCNTAANNCTLTVMTKANSKGVASPLTNCTVPLIPVGSIATISLGQ